MQLSKKNIPKGKLKANVKKTFAKISKENLVQRIFEKDTTVWKAGKQYEELIRNRLGWISLPVTMKNNCDEINSFTDELIKEGFKYAVLLGMGGSSMCPEVMKETFGIKEGYLKLFVIDSTDPKTIFDIENSVDIDKTVFIVSSKSGGTIEVDSLFRYFFELVQRRKGSDIGKQFIAITDPGTFLENSAKEKNFRKIFSNPADIGGRYSALSYFGLVPAALIGVDIEKLLSNAEEMMVDCSVILKAEKNPGTIIGALAGEFSKKKKDKLTFILPREICSFGYWAEQLIAESTGKEGVGVVPVEGEQLSKPKDYGDDRLFINFTFDKDKKQKRKIVKKFVKSNFPIIEIKLNDLYEIGGQFYLWEFATAVMGAVLGINPFDEPNVKESKDNTAKVLEYFEKEKKLPTQTPSAVKNSLSLYIDKNSYKKKLPDKQNFEKHLEFFFKQIKSGDYFSLMAYIQNTKKSDKILQDIRQTIKNKLKPATTLGYGPRFLHSTGQLHKGGANNGIFLQIVSNDSKDLEIPGKQYSFKVLIEAQAIGDYESLLKHKRRVMRINIGSNVEKGLKELYKGIKKAI